MHQLLVFYLILIDEQGYKGKDEEKYNF